MSDTKPKPKRKKRRKYIYLINPEGKKVRIHNIRKFARDNKMSINTLYSLAVGRRYEINGWKSLRSPKAEKIEARRNITIINLKTKEVCVAGRSVIKLARKLNLSESTYHLNRMLLKHTVSYRDWVLLETYNLLYP